MSEIARFIDTTLLVVLNITKYSSVHEFSDTCDPLVLTTYDRTLFSRSPVSVLCVRRVRLIFSFANVVFKRENQ